MLGSRQPSILYCRHSFFWFGLMQNSGTWYWRTCGSLTDDNWNTLFPEASSTKTMVYGDFDDNYKWANTYSVYSYIVLCEIERECLCKYFVMIMY